MANFEALQHSMEDREPREPACCVACQRTVRVAESDTLCSNCGMRLVRIDRATEASLAGITPPGDINEDDDSTAAAAAAAHTAWLSSLVQAFVTPTAAGNLSNDQGVLHLLSALGAGVGMPGVGQQEGAAAAAAADPGSLVEAMAAMFGDEHDATPASPEAVSQLQRITVVDPAIDLPRLCSLRVAASTGLVPAFSCVPVPAAFSPSSLPGSHVPVANGYTRTGSCILADPIDCSGAQLRNGELLRGAVVVVERGGGITFARKALLAQRAGAAAVVCIQSAEVWPYVATDAAGEISSSLTIPFVTIRRGDGARLKALLARSSAAPPPAVVSLLSSDDHECTICYDNLVGGAAVVMPCSHVFHEACLLKWLSRRSTCPVCRSDLPTAVVGGANPGRHAEEMRRGVQAITEQWYR